MLGGYPRDPAALQPGTAAGGAVWAAAMVRARPGFPATERPEHPPRRRQDCHTGANPADNYWRSGNVLGAVELTSGIIQRVVRRAGANLAVNETPPDTGRPVIGTPIPD
jgi:hypothetical protein